MFSANVLYAEIVNNEREIDGSRVVGPEGGRDGYGAIAIFGEVGSEAVIGDSASLFQTRHALAYLHVHPAVGCGER